MAVRLLSSVWGIKDVWDSVSLLKEVLNIVRVDLIPVVHLGIAVVA